MEGALRGNLKALRVYTALSFATGIAGWALLISFVPAARYLWVTSSSFTGGHEDVSFFVAAVILLLFSVFCLNFKILLTSNYFISFDICFALVAFWILGPVVGTSIAAATTTFDITYRAIKSKKNRFGYLFILFDNLGNRLIRFAIVTALYVFLGGSFPPDGSVKTIALIVVVFFVYFIFNNALYAPSEYFKGNSLKVFWEDSFRIDIFHTFVMFVISYYLSVVIMKLGHGYALLSGILLLCAVVLISRLTRAEKELVKKVDELTILTSVSEASSSGLDLLPMVETFARKMCDALHAEGIGIVFKQPYSTTLFAVQVEAQKSRTKQLPTEEKSYQYESLPLSEPSSKLGSALYEFLQPLETAPFMIPPSVFGVPLIYRGEPIGGMVVYSSNANTDFSNQNELLTTCAHSLVVGMENCFLHLQAIEDPLTSLYNRSYFLYRLQEELSYSNRHDAEFCLMMLDLDDFKVVNDHLGHQAGDEVLKRIGELLRVTLRREDVPARYGGDEFIILLLDCSEQNGYEKAKKLRQLLSIRALPKEKAHGLQIGCSISMISSSALQGDYDIPTILKKLDDALYKAKAEGKNVVVKAE